jgi:hypothetical protein
VRRGALRVGEHTDADDTASRVVTSTSPASACSRTAARRSSLRTAACVQPPARRRLPLTLRADRRPRRPGRVHGQRRPDSGLPYVSCRRSSCKVSQDDLCADYYTSTGSFVRCTTRSARGATDEVSSLASTVSTSPAAGQSSRRPVNWSEPAIIFSVLDGMCRICLHRSFSTSLHNIPSEYHHMRAYASFHRCLSQTAIIYFPADGNCQISRWWSTLGTQEGVIRHWPGHFGATIDRLSPVDHGGLCQ